MHRRGIFKGGPLVRKENRGVEVDVRVRVVPGIVDIDSRVVDVDSRLVNINSRVFDVDSLVVNVNGAVDIALVARHIDQNTINLNQTPVRAVVR